MQLQHVAVHHEAGFLLDGVNQRGEIFCPLKFDDLTAATADDVMTMVEICSDIPVATLPGVDTADKPELREKSQRAVDRNQAQGWTMHLPTGEDFLRIEPVFRIAEDAGDSTPAGSHAIAGLA